MHFWCGAVNADFDVVNADIFDLAGQFRRYQGAGGG
jgi:hypothetical protein